MIALPARDTLPPMARLSDLPVFPLPLVLLPGELLPLHIFEPRYRELVARCLAGPEPFCVVLQDDGGVREVGCLARDLTVLERLGDGRLNVVVSGGEPVRLGALDDEAHAYLSADATLLEDDDEPGDEQAMDAALGAYRSLLGEIGREDAEPLSAGPRLSYAIGARIDVGVQVGQALLESRSERERLGLITGALEQGRLSLRVAAERERRAVRNGRVDPDA
jgi:Lon protease-like protein